VVIVDIRDRAIERDGKFPALLYRGMWNSGSTAKPLCQTDLSGRQEVIFHCAGGLRSALRQTAQIGPEAVRIWAAGLRRGRRRRAGGEVGAEEGEERRVTIIVMPGCPGIHVLRVDEDVDGRDKPGHDES